MKMSVGEVPRTNKRFVSVMLLVGMEKHSENLESVDKSMV